MGKRNTINNNNNSSNVLNQQRILNDLNQMTKNDLKPQFNNNKKGPKKNQKQQQPQQQPQQQVQQEVQQEPKQNGKQKNRRQQQQKQQQVQQQQAQKVKQPQQQPPKPVKPTKPNTSVRNTFRLLSNWEYFTNNEWKKSTKSIVENISKFHNRGDIRSQLDRIQEIQVKYQYKPERKPKSELSKKLNRRILKEAAKAPPGVHAYRMKQLIQDMNSKRRQRATHERVTNLLVKRYTQKMNAFADEYQKAYKAYQESIKENLGVAEIKNSQINANKTFSHQKRLQKKAKLQKKLFRRQSKRILESHTCPAQWTPANEKLFQMATQKILSQGYNGFHYYGRPEYNRSLAWVEANENTTGKESISVATVMACQNSPIPGETRLSQNRVPTVAPNQQKQRQLSSQQKPKKQQVAKEKPMTIKTQTPEQYRERITGRKPKKSGNKDSPSDENQKNGRKGNSGNRKMEQKSSPSVVNPRPATWVTETEYPDSFAWGILQHQPGNGGNNGRSGNRSGGGKKNNNKDETINLLFPKSAPNQGNGGNNKRQQQQQQNGNGNGRKQQNRRPQGTNISELL